MYEGCGRTAKVLKKGGKNEVQYPAANSKHIAMHVECSEANLAW